MQRNKGKQQNRKDQKFLQKNQRYQGKFHAKMGSKKDRNGMDLTESEDIKEEVARIHRTIQKRSS